MFKSTPENKKRKHSEHFLHHQEPLGSQRADRTYCNLARSVFEVVALHKNSETHLLEHLFKQAQLQVET